MATKPKKSGDAAKGIRFHPELARAVEGYRQEAERVTGIRVRFSEAVRVLITAGLERWEEKGKFGETR